MAKQKNIIAFLDHEPPRNPKKLKAAFVDRERELDQVVSHVKAVRQEDPRRILAITGLARVGKSHLLRRATAGLTRSFPAIIDVTITTGHADGRAVLREILHQVSAQLDNAAGKKGVIGDGDRSVLEPVHEIRRVYSEAITGQGTVKISEEASKGLKQRLGASLKSPGLPSIFGALPASLDSTRERSDTESRTLQIPPFDEQSLCDLVSWGHNLVRVRKPGWQTLLVIDDFDILRRSEDGSFDPVPLMQQLSSLAQVE
ncbi:MAG: ATP-binding protein, partial [bacterium]|nr:ATP-binding protein [bacterium]